MTLQESQCRLCGRSSLTEVSGFSRLPRVTSDSKVWPAGGRIAVCSDCGTIQKIPDGKWLAEIAEIYGGYAIYHQAAGAEQPIFQNGAPAPRSLRLLNFIETGIKPTAKAKVLDFGCGTGSALRTFSRHQPAWQLFGAELTERNLRDLNEIPRFGKLFTCKIDEIGEQFDLITSIHSMEHVLDPIETLAALGRRLAPNGSLLVQVPDCGVSPYDLVIADHLTHFTLNALRFAATRAGLKTSSISDSVLRKELTWVGQNAAAEGKAQRPDARDGARLATRGIDWLNAQLEDAGGVAADSRRFGIFGTSISATWMFGAMPDRIEFFVDEDPGRIGREHLGRPVVSPDHIPPQADVYIPLVDPVASEVARRLAKGPGRLHTPPSLETTTAV